MLSVISIFIYDLIGSDVRKSEFAWRKKWKYAKTAKKRIPVNYLTTFLKVMMIFLI